jgi:hypothetical protein
MDLTEGIGTCRRLVGSRPLVAASSAAASHPPGLFPYLLCISGGASFINMFYAAA